MRWIGPMMVVLLSGVSHGVAAQGFTETENLERKHRDFAGKPCLQSSGISRPLASNPRIMDHAVSLDNHCFVPIKVKVCYYHTDECTDVEVPGNSRKEQIIGVFPAIQLFRYDVKEQF